MLSEKNMNKYTIYINIWDDYWDDDSGKEQETYIYIESDERNASKEVQEEILLKLQWYITQVCPEHDFDLIELEIREREYTPTALEIGVRYMTHVQRESIMDKLKDHNLSYKGKKFKIYSES